MRPANTWIHSAPERRPAWNNNHSNVVKSKQYFGKPPVLAVKRKANISAEPVTKRSKVAVCTESKDVETVIKDPNQSAQGEIVGDSKEAEGERLVKIDHQHSEETHADEVEQPEGADLLRRETKDAIPSTPSTPSTPSMQDKGAQEQRKETQRSITGGHNVDDDAVI